MSASGCHDHSCAAAGTAALAEVPRASARRLNGGLPYAELGDALRASAGPARTQARPAAPAGRPQAGQPGTIRQQFGDAAGARNGDDRPDPAAGQRQPLPRSICRGIVRHATHDDYFPPFPTRVTSWPERVLPVRPGLAQLVTGDLAGVRTGFVVLFTVCQSTVRNPGRNQAGRLSFPTGAPTTLRSRPSCVWLRPTPSSSCASASLAAATPASPAVECRPTCPVRADPPPRTIRTTTGTITGNPGKDEVAQPAGRTVPHVPGRTIQCLAQRRPHTGRTRPSARTVYQWSAPRTARTTCACSRMVSVPSAPGWRPNPQYIATPKSER